MRQWWLRRSLRFRLGLWYSVGGAVLLVAFSATIYIYVSNRMARGLDRYLRADLEEIKKRLRVTADGQIWWDGQTVPAGTDWSTYAPWFELWSEQGQLMRRLLPLNEEYLDKFLASPQRSEETLAVVQLDERLSVRVLSVRMPIAGSDRAWIVRVIRLHRSAADALSELLLIIIVASPLVVTLLVYGGYVVTRHWLSPLDVFVGAAEKITAQGRAWRLPVPNPHDELGRLATVFNGTLDRLENSFVALDRFVADSSHELRTPLTTLRSVGEVALSRERSADDYREVIGSMLEEAHRLQLLVDRLLQLARAEGGAQKIVRAPVRVDELATVCAEELSVLAEEKGQRIVVRTVPCELSTDETLFKQALLNLVDNAIKYGPENGSVEVCVEADDGSCRITVKDDGPGIAAEYHEKIMERFFRTDDARARTPADGYGLGLAITKAYMQVLGGKLYYEERRPHGSVFGLTLPR